LSDKFDEFSKHLARKQTRRGALKFLGAGLVSAFLGTVFSRTADADRSGRGFTNFIQFNSTQPNFNQTLPRFNQTFTNPKSLDSASRSFFRKFFSIIGR
jgi:hypothetical protein